MPLGKFTGEGLAQALLLHLSNDELVKFLDNKKEEGWFCKLLKKIRRKKLFLITFWVGKRHMGFILPAEDEYSACIEVIPFLNDDVRHSHVFGEARFQKDCSECQRIFGQFATWLNSARVRFVGWTNRYSENIVIRI